MESCGMSFMKYVLFIFNLIFAISGAGIIVAGALVLANVGEFGYFLEDRIIAPPIVLIVAGAIVFFVAFLGCCGAIKESYNMLMAFAFLLLLIFIVELAVGITAALTKNDFSGAMKSQMQKTMINYNKSEFDRQAWDGLQRKLKCCGVVQPEDWASITPPNTIPIGCCLKPTDGYQSICYNSDDGDLVYQDGCFEKLKMRVEEGAVILMGVGIGIAFVEIIGIIFAFCLASAIKKDKEEVVEEEPDVEAVAEEEEE